MTIGVKAAADKTDKAAADKTVIGGKLTRVGDNPSRRSARLKPSSIQLRPQDRRRDKRPVRALDSSLNNNPVADR